MIGASSVTPDSIIKVWREVCETGRSSLCTVNPWTEFQGNDIEHALFYSFQRTGALTVVARGPGRLHCFEARGPKGAAYLQRLGSATAIGNTAAAIRKLNLDPADTMDQLFELYDNKELELVRSPDKTFVFRTRDLRDDDVQSIAADTATKVKKRLDGLASLVELIEAGADPTSALAERFGMAAV